MTEFVMKLHDKAVESNKNNPGWDYTFEFEKAKKYAQLLQTPLELSQFIPCKNGEPLEKPHVFDSWEMSEDMPNLKKSFFSANDSCIEYQEALDKVLFEGWETSITYSTDNLDVVRNGIRIEFYKYKTIEDLINSGIELTPSKPLNKQIEG